MFQTCIVVGVVLDMVLGRNWIAMTLCCIIGSQPILV
jgi:hypothetical protein